jgi:hypothetical protein
MNKGIEARYRNCGVTVSTSTRIERGALIIE